MTGGVLRAAALRLVIAALVLAHADAQRLHGRRRRASQAPAGPVVERWLAAQDEVARAPPAAGAAAVDRRWLEAAQLELANRQPLEALDLQAGGA